MTVTGKHRIATIREDEPLSNDSKDGQKPLAEASDMPLIPSGVAASETIRIMGGDYYVRSQRSWIVKLGPVKKHMVKGHLIRTVRGFGFGSKRRKVSIQVQSPVIAESSGGGGLSFGGIFGGGKDRNDNQDLSQSQADAEGILDKLDEHDVVWIRIYKKPKNADDDSSIVSDGGTEMSVDAAPSYISSIEDAEFSIETDTYELSDMEILEQKSKTLECRLGSGNETVVRELRFPTAEEADTFARAYAKMNRMTSERTQEQLTRFRESNALRTKSAVQRIERELAKVNNDKEKGIAILCEIVSALSLPIADVFSTDPYIIVRMGKKEIHRTAVISKDRDPIFTIQTGSLFLLEMSPEEFFTFPSMNFVVKDFDQFGGNEIIGAVHVPIRDVLAGNGERREYLVIPRKNFQHSKNEEFKPRLYLRFRPASKEDISFMRQFEENKKAVGAYVNETFLQYRVPDMSLVKRRHKRGENKEILHRVRPFPDPERPQETKWLTKEQIHEDSMKASKQWIEAGSGGRERVGKVYVEILGCEDLPNMDSLTLDVRDATDAFACIVFEDAIVNTDVIANTLSPRWPSWSQRAFVFNVAHPSSDLLLAVFDFDPEKSPLQLVSRAAASLHDAIGRVQINLSSFYVNTEYTLCYPLYYSEKAEEMIKPNGKIWIRLRKEWDDARRALIVAALPPHPPVFVTVARPVDYQVAHYTTEGAHVETDFSLSIFTEYIQELQSYMDLLDTATDAFMTVWLWRGHFPVTIMGRSILLPLHSMTAYFWATTVTRNFNTLPSFFFFSIGWLLLATNECVNKNPSVWHRTPHFTDGLRLLFGNKWTARGVKISPKHNAEAVEAYNKESMDRVARRKQEKELELKYDTETRNRLGVVVEDAQAADDEITESQRGNVFTKVKDFVNPMTLTVKPVLHPIQLQLRTVVIGLRIVKSIIMWDDSYYAFWLVLVSFVISVLLIWIPWGWMMRWLFRVIAWVGLGPWMMLVDQKYFRENPNLTEQERDALIRKKVEDRYEAIIKAATDYQIRKERIVKLKSMSRYMFGRFHLRVPRFNEDLFTVAPLEESFAKPYDPSKAEPIQVIDRKYGQRLEGDMIPMRDIQIAKMETGPKREGRLILPARAGRFFGRLRKNVAPIEKRVMDSIAEGEQLITENWPLLGIQDGRNGRQDQSDTSEGLRSESITSQSSRHGSIKTSKLD